MQIYPSMSPLQLGGKQGSAVALGYFDGIHIGHRTVICGAVDWAQAHGAAAALFTFKLPGGSKIKGKRLFSVEDKRRIVAGLGVDHYLVPTFADIMAMTPELRIEEPTSAIDANSVMRSTFIPAASVLVRKEMSFESRVSVPSFRVQLKKTLAKVESS